MDEERDVRDNGREEMGKRKKWKRKQIGLPQRESADLMLEVKDHMGIGSPQSCMERKSADLTFEVKDNMDEEKNVREKGKRKKKRKRTKSVHPKLHGKKSSTCGKKKKEEEKNKVSSLVRFLHY
eukprot:Em0012g942a